MEINQIKETCLYVSDIAITRRFYGKKLGFKEIAFRENAHVYFEVGNSMLLFFNAEVSSKNVTLPTHHAVGEQHIAFEVDSGRVYDKSLLRIRGAGIVIEHMHRWPSGHRSFFFRDPDQHSLEIVEKGRWEG